MDKDKKENQNQKKTLYPFRNLENYKSMHARLAESKGKGIEFQAAPTLTAARRILFGK